jgi:hypothetical protein
MVGVCVGGGGPSGRVHTREKEEETAKRKREEAKEVRGRVCVVVW